MATQIWLALFLVLAMFSVSHADYVIYNVPERIQEHSNWCWDASSQSILNYYEHFPSQCAIANYAFSRSDCCGSSTFYWNHPCDTGNYLCIGRGMDAVLDNYGPVSSYCAEHPLPQYTVQYEANAHRPFGMRFDWKGGGAHALVGRGYSSGYVYYMDPWPGNGYTVSSYAYVVESSSHWWTRTLRIRTPGETNLLNPSGTISDTTPTYSWQKVTDATWYRLYVNRGSSNVYAKWLSSSDYSCSGSTCSYTPTTVLASGDHTWWVQTWNSYGYGPWSNSKNFTVAGCLDPGKVTLTSPSGVISTSTPTYRWVGDGPATWYRLYVWNDTDSKLVVDEWKAESTVCSGTACSYNPGVAVEADNHRWWIQTWNSCGGYGPWSNSLSFSRGKPAKATLISPSGTIYTNNPSYRWYAVPTATWYKLYVYDYTTNQAVIDQWYTAASAGCSSGTGTCELFPNKTLNQGSHRWWLMAFNGLYGDWSNSLAFNVSTACGFNEQFNSGNAANWARFSGYWNVVSSLWYYTAGVANKSASTAYNYALYSNADYRAKLWRVGTSTYSNRLLVRASGAILSDGNPANCYMFQYGSDGEYSVWKRVNGTYTAVKYWTASSYINKGSAWNELRAYVSGTYLWFSINGHYVWSGYDSSLTSGRFGLGMYKGSGGSLYVDWARLDCLSGAAGGEGPGDSGQISPEQQALNEAADAKDQIRDETGTQ